MLNPLFLFVTGPGPASGDPKPGKDNRPHMPEKPGFKELTPFWPGA
jgi:hypothetical protein